MSYSLNLGTNRILVIDRSTGVISYFAGTGSLGYTGDRGPAYNATLK
jgi:hypothetical protein